MEDLSCFADLDRVSLEHNNMFPCLVEHSGSPHNESKNVMPRILFIRSAHRDLVDVSPGTEILF